MPDIRAEVIRRGLVASISEVTIWRWLTDDAIKPWTQRSLDLPAIRTSGRRRRESSTSTRASGTVARSRATSSSSESTRRRASRPASAVTRRIATTARYPMLVEHEYERAGALQYLATGDVHRAKLFVQCEPPTGIEPFGRLVEQVAAAEPYRSADAASLFHAHYECLAQPFKWKFTRADLTKLLERLTIRGSGTWARAA